MLVESGTGFVKANTGRLATAAANHQLPPVLDRPVNQDA